MVKYQTPLFWLALFLLCTLFCLSLATGAGVYGAREVFGYLTHNPLWVSDEKLAMVLNTLRLPRTLCAMVVGASLSLAASLLQSATRNPLAEPGLLGVSEGAVFALVVGITWFGAESAYSYLIWAGFGALFGNVIVLVLSTITGSANPLKLILVGVALSATFRGLSSFLLFSNKMVLEQYRFWVLGSLSAANLDAIIAVLPFVLAAFVITLLLCRQLTLMQMGDSQAQALGIHPNRVRIGVLLAATLFTASAIAIAGPIGFVGFLAAYCGRLVEPVKLSVQVCFSALFGMLFLLLADILARWLIQPFELPNGVILALIGAPVLIAIVHRGGFRTLLTVK